MRCLMYYLSSQQSATYRQDGETAHTVENEIVREVMRHKIQRPVVVYLNDNHVAFGIPPARRPRR